MSRKSKSRSRTTSSTQYDQDNASNSGWYSDSVGVAGSGNRINKTEYDYELDQDINQEGATIIKAQNGSTVKMTDARAFDLVGSVVEAAFEGVADTSKAAVNASLENIREVREDQLSGGTQETTKTMLYIAGGVAGAAVLASALKGSDR